MDAHWVDVADMRRDTNRAYCAEALDLVEQFGLEHVMTFQHDFDPEIIAQFYASVHFHTKDDRPMTWMTNGHKMTSSWKEFIYLLQIPDEGLHNPTGFRPHANPESANKDKLLPFYEE